ncbi:MAG: carotenoid oxygenase family protein [Myxococcota bacterium]|nr:carotenoid oxygenase family protein [Myxococcota bacterium]
MSIEVSLSPRARAWNAAMVARPGSLDLHIDASRIDGEIPRALRGGRVLSNGPGWTRIGDKLAHPFDGHGYVRAFELAHDGSVQLRARFVATRAHRDEAAVDRIVHRGLGTNVGDHFWENLRLGAGRNVANTTIVPWAGKLLAGWEGGVPHALDAETLDTHGEETFGGALSGHATLAHTRHDVAQERLVFCSITMGPKTKLTFREVDSQGRVVDTRSAEVSGPMLAHDFVITPRWYVIGANPLRFKYGELARTLLGASTLIRCLETNDAVPGAIHLVPRGRPGPVCTVTLPGRAFVVHYGNAFEQGDVVHVDACLFSTFAFGAEFGYQGPSRPLDPTLPDRRAPQRLYRMSIREGASEGTWEQLASHGIDFPRVHPAHDGVDTPWLFGATSVDTNRSDPFDSIIGVDLRDRARPPQMWTAPHDTFVGEPLFAPSAERADAGHVLALIADGMRERTTLAILDAEHLAAGPVASVHLPLLPFAFHGHFERRCRRSCVGRSSPHGHSSRQSPTQPSSGSAPQVIEHTAPVSQSSRQVAPSGHTASQTVAGRQR